MKNKASSSLNRRNFLTSMAGLGAMTAVGGSTAMAGTKAVKGRLNQGVCKGVFKGLKYKIEDMAREASRLGFQGIDLVGPETFPVLKQYGLMPTMVGGGSKIKAGINDTQYHSTIEPLMREAIKATSDFGAPNVILLAGTRDNISDEEGLDNTVKYLNKIKAQAEDQGVTLCMELLNSKVNHPGYMCDNTAWGVEMCKRVGSPNVKLLYDIYHMQIMEGDIIRTITDNFEYIGHFHTAGNPGRHEFDETQEIYYPPICRTIADLGYKGYFSHEYTPTKDPLKTLEKMRDICIV